MSTPKRIRAEVWTVDGRHVEEIRPDHDREFYNGLPFGSDSVAVTRVTDLDD